MALTTFVYIRDVDNLSDARYAAGIGVDLVGFRLHPTNKGALNPEQFRDITEWISGVKIVGEFGQATPAEIEQLLANYKVNYILISYATYLYEFTQLNKPLILKVEMSEKNKIELPSTLEYCSGSVDYFLLESDKDFLTSEEEILIKTLASKFPVILGFGINLGNASSIVDHLKLKGISLKGSSELRPGYKDFDELADILETLEAD